MCSALFRCAVFAFGVICSQAAAAQSPKAVRRVEIIPMSSPSAPATERDVVPGIEEAAASGVSPPLAGVFRTHDLSRRWVAFEMANGFASSAGARPPTTTSATDPSADVYMAQLGSALQPSNLPPAPPIVIPAWMQGGLAFSTAVTSVVPGCAGNDYRPSGFLDSGAEARRSTYYAVMSNIACEYGIPVGLFDAMIIRESRYKADVFSSKKAFGLTQLMPNTAAGLGVNRYDVEQNLRGGARYLRQQLDSFGKVHLALAAYNAGPGRVRNGLIPPIAETQAYVDNVLLNWQRLAGMARVAAVQPRATPAPLQRMQVGRVARVYSY